MGYLAFRSTLASLGSLAAFVALAALPSCTSTVTSSNGSGGTNGGNGGGNGNGGAGGGNGGGGGNTVTLGPDITPTPTNELRCSDGTPVQINPTFPQPLINQGASSCTVLTFLPPTGQALGSGTAVSASIKVGPTTGKMRFVRMRMLYQHGTGPKCCSLEEYGEIFTPSANDITTVPLGFAMTEEPTPPANDTQTIIANDVIALEVLAPDVPLPGYWPKNGAQVPDIANYVWLPSLSEAAIPAPSGQLLNYTASYSGFVPLFTIAYAPGG